MKRTFTILASAALMIGTAQTTKAQSTHSEGYLPCSTDQAMEAAYSLYPGMREEMAENRRIAEEQDRAAFALGYPHSNSYARNGNQSTQSPPTYTLAVVFHVIHDYGSENITDAQIYDAMRIINEDYRKLNADTISIATAFLGIADDTEIEFRLAQKDPQGNCTNGIDRIASTETYIGDDGSKLNPWDRSKYINIWVVKQISSGAAGYSLGVSSFTPAAIDGVVVLSHYVGSIGTSSLTTSRTVTHEVGHHLNLDHTWGNTNNPGVACGNDGVSDTPETEGWTTCNLTNNDICNAGIEENVQNYMDYAYCYRMFSSGQGSRMRTCLTSSTAQRSTLVTAATALATGINSPQNCAPIADFGPTGVQYVCQGGSLTFYDNTFNAQATGYNWTFQGGTPSSISGDTTPTVQYNTAGTYSVNLVSSNAQGSDNFSRTNYVVVVPTTATYQTSWFEGVENTATFNADWDIYNPQGNGWVSSTTAAATGSRSMRYDNTGSAAGTTDEAMGPTVNLAAMTVPGLSFKVAYAQRTTANTDRLRVYISTDCGVTWSQRYSKAGALLSTHAATTSSYVPAANEWRTDIVTFTAAQMASTNARIKFVFESDGGNDIFIDDINIMGGVGVAEQDNAISTFDVYPNPAQDNTMVEFNLSENSSVNVEMMDMSGKVVQQIYNGSLATGNHRIPVSTAELSSGIYLVRLMTGEGNYLTRKLIVE
jgi:PKD repeat protein